MNCIVKIPQLIILFVITTLAFGGCSGDIQESESPSIERPVEQRTIAGIGIADYSFGAITESATELLTEEPSSMVESTEAETEEETKTETQYPSEEPTEEPKQDAIYATRKIHWDSSWEFADQSKINSGSAVLYSAKTNRKGIIVGINAGHGTSGGEDHKTYCHPDMTPKTTGGSTSAGSLQAFAVGKGTTLYDGTPEAEVTLEMAIILKNLCLEAGYDVLMIRDGEDVQLDNVARTVMCNNVANCHISIHWDEDGMKTDKGCFFLSVPTYIREMYPVSTVWQKSNALGEALIAGLQCADCKIWEDGKMAEDLTQTSYSKIPSVSIELGNQASDHSKEALNKLGKGLLNGINEYFEH